MGRSASRSSIPEGSFSPISSSHRSASEAGNAVPSVLFPSSSLRTASPCAPGTGSGIGCSSKGSEALISSGSPVAAARGPMVPGRGPGGGSGLSTGPGSVKSGSMVPGGGCEIGSGDGRWMGWDENRSVNDEMDGSLAGSRRGGWASGPGGRSVPSLRTGGKGGSFRSAKPGWTGSGSRS